MQTFLPYRSFVDSARVLDGPRLGKQRVEVIQILKALTVPGYAWRNHPATLMWEGFSEGLCAYGLAMTSEWVSRGHADSCAPQYAPLAGLGTVRSEGELASLGLLPPWLGDEALHRSHQSALLRKDREHYGRFFSVPDDLEYVWPRRSEKVLERERRARERLARQREALLLEEALLEDRCSSREVSP